MIWPSHIFMLSWYIFHCQSLRKVNWITDLGIIECLVQYQLTASTAWHPDNCRGQEYRWSSQTSQTQKNVFIRYCHVCCFDSVNHVYLFLLLVFLWFQNYEMRGIVFKPLLFFRYHHLHFFDSINHISLFQ